MTQTTLDLEMWTDTVNGGTTRLVATVRAYPDSAERAPAPLEGPRYGAKCSVIVRADSERGQILARMGDFSGTWAEASERVMRAVRAKAADMGFAQ